MRNIKFVIILILSFVLYPYILFSAEEKLPSLKEESWRWRKTLKVYYKENEYPFEFERIHNIMQKDLLNIKKKISQIINCSLEKETQKIYLKEKIKGFSREKETLLERMAVIRNDLKESKRKSKEFSDKEKQRESKWRDWQSQIKKLTPILKDPKDEAEQVRERLIKLVCYFLNELEMEISKKVFNLVIEWRKEELLKDIEGVVFNNLKQALQSPLAHKDILSFMEKNLKTPEAREKEWQLFKFSRDNIKELNSQIHRLIENKKEIDNLTRLLEVKKIEEFERLFSSKIIPLVKELVVKLNSLLNQSISDNYNILEPLRQENKDIKNKLANLKKAKEDVEVKKSDNSQYNDRIKKMNSMLNSQNYAIANISVACNNREIILFNVAKDQNNENLFIGNPYQYLEHKEEGDNFSCFISGFDKEKQFNEAKIILEEYKNYLKNKLEEEGRNDAKKEKITNKLKLLEASCNYRVNIRSFTHSERARCMQRIHDLFSSSENYCDIERNKEIGKLWSMAMIQSNPYNKYEDVQKEISTMLKNNKEAFLKDNDDIDNLVEDINKIKLKWLLSLEEVIQGLHNSLEDLHEFSKQYLHSEQLLMLDILEEKTMQKFLGELKKCYEETKKPEFLVLNVHTYKDMCPRCIYTLALEVALGNSIALLWKNQQWREEHQLYNFMEKVRREHNFFTQKTEEEKSSIDTLDAFFGRIKEIYNENKQNGDKESKLDNIFRLIDRVYYSKRGKKEEKVNLIDGFFNAIQSIYDVNKGEFNDSYQLIKENKVRGFFGKVNSILIDEGQEPLDCLVLISSNKHRKKDEQDELRRFKAGHDGDFEEPIILTGKGFMPMVACRLSPPILEMQGLVNSKGTKEKLTHNYVPGKGKKDQSVANSTNTGQPLTESSPNPAAGDTLPSGTIPGGDNAKNKKSKQIKPLSKKRKKYSNSISIYDDKSTYDDETES